MHQPVAGRRLHRLALVAAILACLLHTGLAQSCTNVQTTDVCSNWYIGTVTTADVACSSGGYITSVILIRGYYFRWLREQATLQLVFTCSDGASHGPYPANPAVDTSSPGGPVEQQSADGFVALEGRIGCQLGVVDFRRAGGVTGTNTLMQCSNTATQRISSVSITYTEIINNN